MMPQKIPMTHEGYLKLKEDLKHLKSVLRPKIVQEIEEARALGDLSENAEYHAAKEQQAIIEGKIREYEDKLGRAEIIDVTQIRSDRVTFGATVSLLDLNTDETLCYQIVGEMEGDLSRNRISVASPLARGLIGKREGEEAHITTPGGLREMEILKIEYK